jgi:hypothetical protein
VVDVPLRSAYPKPKPQFVCDRGFLWLFSLLHMSALPSHNMRYEHCIVPQRGMRELAENTSHRLGAMLSQNSLASQHQKSNKTY